MVGIRYGAGASLRTVDLDAAGYPQLFGVHAPASPLARLFTSSPSGASARTTARLDGLTDRAKSPPVSFPRSSDLRSYPQGGCWFVQDSKHSDQL